MDEEAHEALVVRHGETLWALEGRHTGRSDIPLTERGRRQAELLAARLWGRRFARVLVSPLQRARETCRLAGFGAVEEICEDLVEWDYGAYEGKTMHEIQVQRPGWSLWEDGPPGGEALEEVGRRVDRVIATIRSTPGDVALFSHGHASRILAARWVGLPPKGGSFFGLDPAGMGILGYEHTVAVIARWNETPGDDTLSTAQGG